MAVVRVRAVAAAEAVAACRQCGSGSGGGQCVGSETVVGMATAATATAVLPLLAATVATKTPAVTVMGVAQTTINN
jgi:hypothetical protein